MSGTDSSSASAGEPVAGTSSHFSFVTPFNYLFFLAASLLLFLGYLILPKGIRAQYCGAARRRYRRQRRRRMPQQSVDSPQPQSLPPADVLDNIYAYSHSFSPQENVDQLGGTPVSSRNIKSEIINDQASAIDSVWTGVDESQGTSEVSGANSTHNQLPLPQQLKMMLQQPPGIKLIAHGTKCRPRPVWITLQYDTVSSSATTPPEYRNCMTWRAELKASSSPHNPSLMSPPESSTKLGNLRKVDLTDILGIEMGKRTTALRRVQTAKGVHESDCFSLLTKTGTLDLECMGLAIAGGQASGEEVRAAFITCLAVAMSSNSLQLNGLQPTNPQSLQSQLDRLNGSSSPQSARWDENTMFTGLMSDARTISTVSF